jgi:mono/diheme cytochrome c family protein
VPADRIEVSPALGQGMVDNVYVDKNPVLLTTAFVEMGQRKFDVFCAPCHGVLGNGVSVVAQKMALRRAPSLVADRIRDFPDGRIFRVITDGYGLMPKYSQELEVVERWAIVAYVRALGIHAAGVSMDHLPEPVRARAEEALK